MVTSEEGLTVSGSVCIPPIPEVHMQAWGAWLGPSGMSYLGSGGLVWTEAKLIRLYVNELFSLFQLFLESRGSYGHDKEKPPDTG